MHLVSMRILTLVISLGSLFNKLHINYNFHFKINRISLQVYIFCKKVLHVSFEALYLVYTFYFLNTLGCITLTNNAFHYCDTESKYFNISYKK